MATKTEERTGADKLAAARSKNLDLAIQQIAKDYGEGGFPRGRIVEIYGPESSGKTTLTLTVIAQAQKTGGLAAFIDVEHALDPGYARKLGVKMEELLVSQPSSGEEALRICETLVRSNALDVIVIDSVAALVTRQELEGEIGDATVGAQARLMSAALRKLTAIIAKARTFYSSMRIDIRRIGAIKTTDGTSTGNRTRVKVVKNKMAPPYTEAEFDLMYNEGISGVGSLLDLALEFDILQKRGSWISYKGTQLAQGRDACKDALRNDAALYADVEVAVKERLAEKGGATGKAGADGAES